MVLGFKQNTPLSIKPIFQINKLYKMEIQEVRERIAELTSEIHKMERIAKNVTAFEGTNFPVKSPKLQIAINEIETARMCVGDLLRLIVLDDKARYPTRFIPADYGATCTEDLTNIVVNSDEKQVIGDMKSNLRDLLYQLLDFHTSLAVQMALGKQKFSLNEYNLYCQMAYVALKKADQQLGLRLGEIQ